MTEEQMKTKWCPFWGIIAKGTADSGMFRCLGSECAMWRETLRRRIPSGNTVVEKIVRNGEPWNAVKQELIDEISGYCGLAGKP